MKKINLKKINFDNIVDNCKRFIIKHKILTISSLTIVLLTCVSILISYAYYQVVETEKIVSSMVGEIPDIDVRILVEDRNDDGSAIKGKYIEYPYVPKAGYEYNSKLSYCTSGSKLNYFEDSHSVTVDTTGTDLCFAYFDSIANLDIVLNVEIEDINEIGEGQGTYKRIDSADMPAVGYTMASGTCTNDATVSYNLDENRFVILTDGKTVCDVKMDAVAADVVLFMKVQESKDSENYIEVKELPTNQYYTLQRSDCTGSGGATVTFENQEVAVKTTEKTVCYAYFDITDGPIAESASIANISNDKTTFNLAGSSLGTAINKWYYSLDDGDNYQELKDGVITEKVTDNVIIYGEDAKGQKSGLVELDPNNTYYYQGLYEANSEPIEKEIEANGYYYLQGWGASEAADYNLGSYAEGYIYLNKGDKLYINVGSMPSQDTIIKVNRNQDDYAVLIAGGTSSSYVFNEENPSNTKLDKKYYLINSYAYSKYDLFKSPTDIKEAGHAGNGYAKVTYLGENLEEEK